MVLKAVRRLDPYYEPNYTPPALDYDCPLVEKIKLENVDNRKGLMTSPANGLLTLEELRAKGKEQLAMEMAGEIEVQNIFVMDEVTNNVELYVSNIIYYLTHRVVIVTINECCHFYCIVE